MALMRRAASKQKDRPTKKADRHQEPNPKKEISITRSQQTKQRQRNRQKGDPPEEHHQKAYYKYGPTIPEKEIAATRPICSPTIKRIAGYP